MKAISLLQPWATLVVIGAKKIETRSWNTKYRGEVLIHASAGKDKQGYALWHSKWCWDKVTDNRHFVELPFGAIIGKVNIVDTCDTLTLNAFGHSWGNTEITEQERAFGDYANARYGWLLSDPVQFDKITPAKGMLQLWDFKEQICLKCGCTEGNACVSQVIGACWWVKENLCSHCEAGRQNK